MSSKFSEINFAKPSNKPVRKNGIYWSAFVVASREKEDGARCRFRTCDPYRVKVMLYH